jgi:hypothetical protein
VSDRVAVSLAAPQVVVRPGTVPVAADAVGYGLVQPLADWATISDPGGVTYEETATGIEFTIASGDGDVSDPTTAWYATGLLSEAIAGTVAETELAAAGSWWQAAIRILMMRRAALTGANVWAEMYVTDGAFSTAGNTAVGVGIRLASTTQQTAFRTRVSSNWTSATDSTSTARGIVYAPPYGPLSGGGTVLGRINGPLVVDADGDLIAAAISGSSSFLSWTPSNALHLTIAVGRVATGGSGTISVAPQVYAAASRLAVGGA